MHQLGFVVLALSIGFVTRANTQGNKDPINEAETTFLNKLSSYLSYKKFFSFIKISYLDDLSTYHTLQLHKFSFYELTYMAKRIYDTKYEAGLINRIDLMRLATYLPFDKELERLERVATCRKNMFFRMNSSIYMNRMLDQSIYPQLKQISAWDLSCLDESIKKDGYNIVHFPWKKKFFEEIKFPKMLVTTPESILEKQIRTAENDLLNSLWIQVGRTWTPYFKKSYISEFQYFDISLCTFFELTYMAKLIYDTEFEEGMIQKIDAFRLRNYMSFADLTLLEEKATCRKNMFYRMDNSLYTNNLKDFKLYPQLEYLSAWDLTCLKESIASDQSKGIHNQDKIEFSRAFENVHTVPPTNIVHQIVTDIPAVMTSTSRSEHPNKFNLKKFLNKYYIGASITIIAFIIMGMLIRNRVDGQESLIESVMTTQTEMNWTREEENDSQHSNTLYYVIGACVFGSIMLLLVAIYLFKSNEEKSKKDSYNKTKWKSLNRNNMKTSNIGEPKEHNESYSNIVSEIQPNSVCSTVQFVKPENNGRHVYNMASPTVHFKESYTHQFKKDSFTHQFKKDSFPHQFKKDSFPHQFKKDSFTHQFKKDSFPHQFKKDSFPHQFKKDSFTHQFKKDSFPHQFKKDSFTVQHKMASFNAQPKKDFSAVRIKVHSPGKDLIKNRIKAKSLSGFNFSKQKRFY